MKNENVQGLLKELIVKINKDTILNCVILFGSRARRDFTAFSDIDLIFVGNFKKKFFDRSTTILKLLSHNFKVGLDVFCYTPEEFRNMFYDGTVSILDAIDHGMCLYGFDFYNEYKDCLEQLKTRGLKREPPVWILPKNMLLE